MPGVEGERIPFHIAIWVISPWQRHLRVPSPGSVQDGGGGPGPPGLAGLALVNSLATPLDTPKILGRQKPYLRNTAVPRTVPITRARKPGDPRDMTTFGLSAPGARLRYRRNDVGMWRGAGHVGGYEFFLCNM